MSETCNLPAEPPPVRQLDAEHVELLKLGGRLSYSMAMFFGPDALVLKYARIRAAVLQKYQVRD